MIVTITTILIVIALGLLVTLAIIEQRFQDLKQRDDETDDEYWERITEDD